MSSSSERRGNTALWDSGSGGGDRPGHQEAEGVGSPSARGEEPADPLGHRLHPAGAAGSGAYHRGLELPLGCHHPTAHRSHRCWYCSLLWACVFVGERTAFESACVWWNKVSVHISIFISPLWWTLRRDLSCDYNHYSSFFFSKHYPTFLTLHQLVINVSKATLWTLYCSHERVIRLAIDAE